MRPRQLLIGFAVALAACASSPDQGTVMVSSSLDGGTYRTQVHVVVERSCGKTDCHGRIERGLRVYGATALRLPNASGPTTQEELDATFQSIEGLEPEKLNEFLSETPRSTEKAYKLLVLGKPLQLERHRGGISLRKGEPAERCISTWLLGNVDAAACAVR